MDPGDLPQVSVVMGAYNAAATVGDAVGSICAQDFDRWELVVVDDGSTDGTSHILEEWAAREPRIRVIRHPVNRGLPSSANHALRKARGKYIARMDADDRALPDRLRVQAHFLDSHPEVDILGGGAVEIDAAGHPMGEARPPERHEDLVADIFKRNPFINPTVMARRAVFEELGGYDERHGRGEDYELWLRAYTRFRFTNLQRPLIWYSRRRFVPWKDALACSRIVYDALRLERRLLRNAWLVARPVAATVWDRVAHGTGA